MNNLDSINALVERLADAKDLGAVSDILADGGQLAFGSSACCVFIRRPDDRLEMLAERNCTARFKDEWRFIPSGALAFADDRLTKDLFIGSAIDFKNEVPTAAALVDASKRQMIGYAPLRSGARVLGVFGFSYDAVPDVKPDAQFTRLFTNVAALSLGRYFVAPLGKTSPLSLVPR